MTTALLIAWPFLGALVVLAWSRWLRHLKALEEAVKRHPAGTRADGVPWFGHVGCCGQKIYGDTLEDLAVNESYHRSQCPHNAWRNAG